MNEDFARFEHDFWETASAPYDAGFGTITAQTAPALIKATGVKSGDHILDIACGPGYLIPECMKRDAHITGLDFSSAMIALAKKRYPSALLKSGDAQDLPFKDNSFDAAICAFGLMHFPDPFKAIREALRVLKPGSRYAFTVWDAPTSGNFMGIMIETIKECGNFDIPLPQGHPFFKYSDSQGATDTLTEAGFIDTHPGTLSPVWTVPTLEAFITAFMDGGARIGGILRGQTPGALEKIRARLAEKLEPFKKQGNFLIPAGVIMAHGKKR